MALYQNVLLYYGLNALNGPKSSRSRPYNRQERGLGRSYKVRPTYNRWRGIVSPFGLALRRKGRMFQAGGD
jgi:hypothetical protein